MVHLQNNLIFAILFLEQQIQFALSFLQKSTALTGGTVSDQCFFASEASKLINDVKLILCDIDEFTYIPLPS